MATEPMWTRPPFAQIDHDLPSDEQTIVPGVQLSEPDEEPAPAPAPVGEEAADGDGVLAAALLGAITDTRDALVGVG